MTDNPNFDTLAQKSFAPGATTEDYERLFGAAFALSEWHFIAAGQFPVIAPYCAIFPGVFENLPMVATFTDTERLRQFAKEKNISGGSASDPIILSPADTSVKFSSDKLIFSVLPESFLGYIEKLIESGVQGIFFNPNKDSAGFFISLKQLGPIREHLESKNMLPKREPKPADPDTSGTSDEKDVAAVESLDSVNFDTLSVKATQTGATEDLDALFGAAFALSEWHFITRGELPNVHPYISSHPDYADNQPMIHAFTDGRRLQRFAAENNLTEPDGLCIFFSLPTNNIIEYLEKFIPLGIHGIWFNSDTESDGFFIPLKQLRPIREHLAKSDQQNKNALKQSPVETLQFVVKEGLMLPSADIIPTPYTINIFWRVPSNWVENGKIKAEHLRTIEREMSGGRSENIEGAFYVVTDYSTILLDPETVRTTKWSGIVHDDDNLYFFFIASEDGEVNKVSAEEFQAVVVAASSQTQVKSAEPQFSEESSQSERIVQKPNVATLLVQIKDGLGFPSGFVKEADYTCHLFCRVPEYWIEGERLKTEYLEKIYERFYGANWRSGNSDGSHFVVRDVYTKILSLETIKNIQWGGTVNDEKNHYWWYLVSPDGEVRSVKEEEFGADISSSLQTAVATDEIHRHQDDEAEFDPNVNINQVGAVNFDTSIRPFYRVIEPLLENYQGEGEYISLLAFDPNGMSELVESIVENSHGAYLQVRRFYYLNPKNNVRIGVNSIRSRHLRHIQTNTELLVIIEICRNLDNQTAALYFRFEGAKSEVNKLTTAIQPILQQYGFEAVARQ